MDLNHPASHCFGSSAWLERQPHVIPYAVYCLLRLILDHAQRPALRDREIELAAHLLRTKVRKHHGRSY